MHRIDIVLLNFFLLYCEYSGGKSPFGKKSSDKYYELDHIFKGNFEMCLKLDKLLSGNGQITSVACLVYSSLNHQLVCHVWYQSCKKFLLIYINLWLALYCYGILLCRMLFVAFTLVACELWKQHCYNVNPDVACDAVYCNIAVNLSEKY